MMALPEIVTALVCSEAPIRAPGCDAVLPHGDEAQPGAPTPRLQSKTPIRIYVIDDVATNCMTYTSCSEHARPCASCH